MSATIDDLVARYRASIERINAATRRHLGDQPVWREGAQVPVVEAARLGLDVALPVDLEAFYRTVDGVQAFGFWIVRISGLADCTRDTRDFMADYENYEALRPLLWGPPPQGAYLAIAGNPAVLVDATGPAIGTVTAHDGAGDSGYHVMAPSIDDMLDAWAVVAENDLIELVGPPERRSLNLRTATSLARVEECLADHPATAASVGIWIEPIH